MMRSRSCPSEENRFLACHAAILRDSFRHWTGRELTPPGMSDDEAARYLYHAPVALLSHDASPDPVFDYANETALELFGWSWEEITHMPSRLSAEPVARAERERLLRTVVEQGYIEDYCGVRIDRCGRRFRIENATLWNLLGPSGILCGQAALIRRWTFLEPKPTPDAP
jgi:PAS domain-containing protein